MVSIKTEKPGLGSAVMVGKGSSRTDVLCSGAAFAPRPSLEGAVIPPGFKLPDLDSVREDVISLQTMLARGGPDPLRVAFVSSKTNKINSYGAGTGNDLPEPLSWNMQLPNLFKFGYFCKVEDVPPELVHPVIWALKMYHRVLSECTSQQLYDAGHYLRHQEPESANAFMITNTRMKLCRHLLDPAVDKPAEAIPYLEAAIELNARQLKDGKMKLGGKGTSKEKRTWRDRPWLYNPFIYSMYASALVYSNRFDAVTKLTLERIIEASDKGSSEALAGGNFIAKLFEARASLALVLREIGEAEDETVWKEHADWSATFLKKNPKLLRAALIVQLLGRPDQPTHPVLERVGGIKWLKPYIEAAIASPDGLAVRLGGDGIGGLEAQPRGSNGENQREEAEGDSRKGAKRATLKQEERAVTKCRQCGAREPMKKLFRCTGCQYVYYCSKECQRANWKLHREGCRERAAQLKRLAELEATDPLKAQRERDWVRWRDSPHEGNSYTLAHALRLHHDPTRGRTHIVLRSLKYTPTTASGKERDLRDRFTVVGAGVFRIADVTGDIERAMGLDPGEGQEYVDSLIDELDSLGEEMGGERPIPILDLTMGEGISPWLGSTALTASTLRTMKYDPEWRSRFNKNGSPADPLKLVSGAKDAELD